MAEIFDFPEPKRATRISVTSSGPSYRVSVDGGPARIVTLHQGEPRCECGMERCVHVGSLRACGFVDSAAGWSGIDEARAA